ncbi:hypothetical protein OVA24_09230 [Luteolibacter sp. SL250]|uniref:hypothetical protein n=1 Tax=Luteolibacter sp. SL250 TaxID=2995170 RepID=UPI00227215DE|nr:hypothetical protein [Luteolibacter sp. SL250]WAC21565.1 hypothetical protein OVA24_09230 [Luteolibacter sp. SL250]
MSSAPKAQTVSQIALPPQRESLATAVEECLQRTATALFQTGTAGKDDLIHAMHLVRQSNSHGQPADLLDTLARHLHKDEDQVASVVASYGERISATLNPNLHVIPFAGKFIAPSTFYEAYPGIQRLGAALMAAVIYAEDADAIGTASVNPIAAVILGEEIAAAVARRVNVRPIITSVMLDHQSWTQIIRKHFQR